MPKLYGLSYPAFVLLTQSKVKIDRANTHIRDIEKRIEAIGLSSTSIVEAHPEHGTDRLTYTLDEAAFDQLAVVIGDAVHNLKCALDYVWLQTIERIIPANVSDRAKFPIHKTIEELKGSLRKGNVDTACPELFDLMVSKIKPFDGGNDAIWPIHNFDNRDKHRLLIPILIEGQIEGMEVQDEAGERYPAIGMSARQRPIFVVDLQKGLHFTKSGRLATRIVVEDEKSGCLMDIPESLARHLDEFARVVDVFESFLQLRGFR